MRYARAACVPVRILPLCQQVIAMLARHTKGIKDCDVGSPSLCVHGADFVRDNEHLILSTYDHYANRTAEWLGHGARVIWLMEPDFHQYTEGTQRGGGLPQSTMVRLFVAMVQRIKRHLPAAEISLDISPWISDVGAWMGRRCTNAPTRPKYESTLCTSQAAKCVRILRAILAARIRRLSSHFWRAYDRRLTSDSRAGVWQSTDVV